MAESSFRGPSWARRALQFFGVLHLAFGAIGLYYLSGGVLRAVTSGYLYRVYAYAPYHFEAYALRTSVNFVFLVILIVAAVFLLRVRHVGVFLSNVLFVAMILYFLFAIPFAGLLGEGFRSSMAATAGTGDMGIAWQILTGYPVVCLVALNLLNYKARRVSASPE